LRTSWSSMTGADMDVRMEGALPIVKAYP